MTLAIMSAAFSPIMIAGALVFAAGMTGMIDASAHAPTPPRAP